MFLLPARSGVASTKGEAAAVRTRYKLPATVNTCVTACTTPFAGT